MGRANGGGTIRGRDVELTERRSQVLRLITEGKTNAEIGEALGISLDGAKWHVSEILSKLDVATREAAADVAPAGTWATHVHVEVSNNNGSASYYSRSYDWDGPSNANDSSYNACSRSSSNSSDCNAKVASTDAIGYVGGQHSSYTELDNPYYPDF